MDEEEEEDGKRTLARSLICSTWPHGLQLETNPSNEEETMAEREEKEAGWRGGGLSDITGPGRWGKSWYKMTNIVDVREKTAKIKRR